MLFGAVYLGYNFVPLSWLDSLNIHRPTFGSTITTINGTDTLSSSRTTINNNFSNLNAGKEEISDLISTTTIPNLAVIGTITTGIWHGTTIGIPYGGTGSTTLSLGELLEGSAANAIYSVATSTIGVSAGLTNTGTLGSQVGGTSLTLQQIENRSFFYATSTAWTGTTTIALEIGYGEVWNTAKCKTNAGTLNVQFGYGTASTTMFNASTTVGTITFTSNNTMTSGNLVKVDLGTPATSPTSIFCTANDTI